MHFRDNFQAQFAHAAFENGHMTAGQVEAQTIRDYEKKLYSFLQLTKKLSWL